MKIILILLFIISANVFSMSDKDYKTIFSSSERLVVDLSGWWRNSYTGAKQYIPSSIIENGDLAFEKDFKIEKKLANNKVWHLFFDGIDNDFEVYVNENFVGKYLGAMTPFYVKVQKNYITSENIKVKIKLSQSENYTRISKTMGLGMMRNYTAISRSVLLIGTSKVWVNNINKLSTKISKNYANISAMVSINSGSLLDRRESDSNSLYRENMIVRVESELLYNGSVVANASSMNFKIESERSIQKNISFGISNPELWSIENPNLYTIRVKVYSNDVLLDSYSNKIGLKTVQFKDGRIYLNGNKILVKGVDYIEDIARKGVTLNYNDYNNDVKLIKKLGANLIRFKYLPPSKIMLDLCDKNGILTLIDLPAYKLPSRISNTSEINARLENISSRFEDMYSTNVSLLAWGLGTENEYDEKPNSIYKFSKKDNIYRAYSYTNLTNLGDDDISLVSIYKSIVNYEELNSIIDKKLKDRKSVILNFGIPVQFDNNNGYLDKLSIQNQANIIRNLFHIVENKNLAGCIINSFNDYLLENPTLRTNNDNIYISSTGLVNRKRNTRLSYETVQALFNSEKEPILDAGSYLEESTISFIIIGLILLLVFIFLLNRIKRFREYFKRSLISPYNFYADIRDQRLISKSITLVIGVMVSLTFGIFLSNFLFHFKNYEAEQYILHLLVPSAFLQAKIFKMIWNPEPFMLMISTIIFLLLFVLSGALKLFSGVSKNRIFFSDTFTIVVWSFIPILIILPFAIVSQKLFILNEGIAITLIAILLILLLWSFLRIVKASSVVFDINLFKVNSTVAIILVVLLILPLTLYQLQNSFIDYIIYFTKFYF